MPTWEGTDSFWGIHGSRSSTLTSIGKTMSWKEKKWKSTRRGTELKLPPQYEPRTSLRTRLKPKRRSYWIKYLPRTISTGKSSANEHHIDFPLNERKTTQSFLRRELLTKLIAKYIDKRQKNLKLPGSLSPNLWQKDISRTPSHLMRQHYSIERKRTGNFDP